MQPGYPYPPVPMQTPPRGGFPGWAIALLVVGGLVLFLGGLFAVLGIYGMRKFMVNAKTAEARNSVGQIAKDAVAAYEREDIKGGTIVMHRLCPSASRSVPASLSMVSGKKYQSVPSEWTVDSTTDSGFACLRFQLDSPQYYMYSYTASGTGVGATFAATAQGDLDGDAKPSLFTVRGRVVPGDVVQVQPNIEETDPED